MKTPANSLSLRHDPSAPFRPLKIVHVIDSLDPKLGGPPIVCAAIAVAQARAGHDVFVVSYRTGDAAEPIQREVADWDKVHHVRVDMGGRVERVMTQRLRSAVESALVHADVMHLHNVWAPAIWAACRTARRMKVPYVWLLNGMLDPWSVSQKSLKKRVALALGVRKLFNDSAAMHLISDHELHGARALGINAPYINVPNGIFLDDFERRLISAEAAHQLVSGVPNKPYFLFLARLHFKKGLDLLIESFGRSKALQLDWHLVIAGPDDGYAQTVHALREASPAREHIHIIGPVFGAQKMAVLKSASAFALTSRQEGFSISILEALAAGLPCVISDECHFSKVGALGAGIVTTLDSGTITPALDTVMQDDAERQRMGTIGRTLVASEYTWPAVAEELVRFYRSLTR